MQTRKGGGFKVIFLNDVRLWLEDWRLKILVEELLSKLNAELLSNILELIEVLLVLFLGLDLDLKTLEQSDSGGVVIDTSACLKSLLEHRGSGDKIVGKGIVENTLDFVKIVGLLELLLESKVLRVSN